MKPRMKSDMKTRGHLAVKGPCEGKRVADELSILRLSGALWVTSQVFE
jgi:hypothetical protein